MLNIYSTLKKMLDEILSVHADKFFLQLERHVKTNWHIFLFFSLEPSVIVFNVTQSECFVVASLFWLLLKTKEGCTFWQQIECFVRNNCCALEGRWMRALYSTDIKINGALNLPLCFCLHFKKTKDAALLFMYKLTKMLWVPTTLFVFISG